MGELLAGLWDHGLIEVRGLKEPQKRRLVGKVPKTKRTKTVAELPIRLSASVEEGSLKRGRKWMANFSKVSEWMSKIHLLSALDGKGITCISDCLPQHVAWAALRALEDTPSATWHR